MTINKQKLLLGLGMASIAIAPVAMVVSCSSSPDQSNINTPAPGVSQEKWNQYIELFGLPKGSEEDAQTKAKTAYDEAIKTATASTETKTEEQVLAATTTQLEEMTTEELEDAIFASLNLHKYTAVVSSKEVIGGVGKLKMKINVENKEFSNVEITNWNKTTKEISFKSTTQQSVKTITEYDYDTKNEKYNKKYESTFHSKRSMEYKNFKLNPVVGKINATILSTGFELISVDKKSTISKPSFEMTMPNKLNEVSKFLINNNEKYNDDEKKAEIKKLEDRDKETDKSLKVIRESYSKIEANKIGKVDGEGEIKINNSNESGGNSNWIDSWISFDDEQGFTISENTNPQTINYSALSFAKPFIFATINKEGSADATITFNMYKTTSSPDVEAEAK